VSLLTRIGFVSGEAMDKPGHGWTYSAPDPTADAVRLMAHPQFAAAARALAAATLDGGDRDPALGTVFKDAGRYVAAMWALYLHASGGMTLPRLKQVCASSGFVSPGRARLLLQVLEHIGFVRAVAPPPGQRARAYLPTAAFIAAWSAHLIAAIRAAALIDPAIARLADRLAEPATLHLFLRIQAARLHRLAAGMVEAPPFQRIFMHRYAGTQIISLLVSNGTGGEFPSSGAMQITINKVAARFGVSHLHVRRMLADAMREGLLDHASNGTVALSEAMRTTLAFFFAMQLVELIASATFALDALEGRA
jgi:hypothetical protein